MKSLLLLFIIFSFAVNAQVERSNKGLLLRGKASTMFIIEDIFFNNWNIGAEYRFAQRHSIGIDYVHFRWRFEQDIYENGMDTGSGPDAFSRRRYLLLDYRYYPFRNMMYNYFFETYINPFVKMGRRKIWSNDPETFYWGNDYSAVRNMRADFTDYGFALGVRYDFGDEDRVGLDANIGAVYREERILYKEQYDGDISDFVESYSGKNYSWKLHMRLNIYVRLFRIT